MVSPRALAVTLGLLGLVSGCTGSRWAKSDPNYAQKYSHHTDDPVRTVKQAVDARHVAGQGGWYSYGAGTDEPNAGEFAVGRFHYPGAYAGALETRLGAKGLLVEGGGVAAGVELGARVQSPSRLAPYAGVSAFVGAAPWDYVFLMLDDDDASSSASADDSYDARLAASIAPEIGAHYWVTPRWRLTASVAHNLSAFEGTDIVDYPTFGLTLARLRTPRLVKKKEAIQYTFTCSDTTTDDAASDGLVVIPPGAPLQLPSLDLSGLPQPGDSGAPPPANPYDSLLEQPPANP